VPSCPVHLSFHCVILLGFERNKWKRSYGEDAKHTQLTPGLFYNDRAGRMDSVNLADNAANNGLLKRVDIGKSHVRYDGTSACRHLFPRPIRDQRGGYKDQVDSQQRRFLPDGSDGG